MYTLYIEHPGYHKKTIELNTSSNINGDTSYRLIELTLEALSPVAEYMPSTIPDSIIDAKLPNEATPNKVAETVRKPIESISISQNKDTVANVISIKKITPLYPEKTSISLPKPDTINTSITKEILTPKKEAPKVAVIAKAETTPVVKKEEPKIIPVAKINEAKNVAPLAKEEVKAPVVVAKPVIVVTPKEEPKVAIVTKTEPTPVVKKEEPKITPVAKNDVANKVTPVVKEEVKAPVVVAKPVITETPKEEPNVAVIAKTENTPIVKKEEPKVTPVAKKEVKAPVAIAKPINTETPKEEPKVAVVPKTEPTPVVKKEEPKATPVAKNDVVVKAPITVPVIKKEVPTKVETKPTETARKDTSPPKDDVFSELFGTETKPTSNVKEVASKKEEADPFSDLFGSTPKPNNTSATTAIKGNVTMVSGEALNGTRLVLKANGRVVDSMTTMINGGFMFSKLPAGTNYEIFAERKGYYSQKVTVNSIGLLPGQVGNVKVNLVNDPNQPDELEPEIIITLKGKILNQSNIPQASAVISLMNNITRISVNIKTDQNGEYTAELKKQSHYTISVEKVGCKSTPLNKSTFGIKTAETLTQNITITCQ